MLQILSEFILTLCTHHMILLYVWGNKMVYTVACTNKHDRGLGYIWPFDRHVCLVIYLILSVSLIRGICWVSNKVFLLITYSHKLRFVFPLRGEGVPKTLEQPCSIFFFNPRKVICGYKFCHCCSLDNSSTIRKECWKVLPKLHSWVFVQVIDISSISVICSPVFLSYQ